MEFPVVVEKVSKSYDGVRDVVKDVDIKVAQGEMVLLWGRNGSGKTTLLNLVGCIDVPSSGKVIVAGKDTSELSPRQLARLRLMSIGHVFQHHNLIDDLTVVVGPHTEYAQKINKTYKFVEKAGEDLKTEIDKLKDQAFRGWAQ